MNWISKYEVEKWGTTTVVKGEFNASAGDFKIEYHGDGGNSDTYKITLSNGQYEIENNKPLEFEIYGAWEIREVIEMFKLLGSMIGKSE